MCLSLKQCATRLSAPTWYAMSGLYPRIIHSASPTKELGAKSATGVGERVVITPLTRGLKNDLSSGCLLRVKLRVLIGVMFLEALLIWLWTGQRSGSGFSDIARPTLGRIYFLDRL
jgi:hypothetical protein